MSQKAICPRGHIWDPSVFEGLPATATPHCPICGEEEPRRARDFVARLMQWGRANRLAAGLSVLCLLLATVGSAALLHARRQAQAARVEAENSEFKAEQAAAKLQSTLRANEIEEERKHKRDNDIQELKWSNREKEFQARLREAEKDALAAKTERDKQFQARSLAEELRQSAEGESKASRGQLKETTGHLIEMHVANGVRRMDSGDLSGSLPSFVSALRLADKQGLPTAAHRLRLSAVLALCPRPVQLWTNEKPWKLAQLSRDGKRALTVGLNGATEVWDTQTGKRIGEAMAHPEAVAHAAIGPDGKQVATTTADGMLHVWDVESSKEVADAVQMMGPVVGLAFSPDGKRFLVVTDKAPMGAMGATEVELRTYNAATVEPTRAEPLGSDLRPVVAAFSPDGKSILAVCQDRCARIWDIGSGKQIGVSLVHDSEVVEARFSPDGEKVATAGARGTARVWNAKTGEPLTPTLTHGTKLRGVSFGPDGRLLLTFDDESARVWDTRNEVPVGTRLRLDETINDAIFSPDGRHLWTLGADGAARGWDYRTGRDALVPLWHGDSIRYAAFAPMGDRLLTFDGRAVRWWDLTRSETLSANPRSSRSASSDLAILSPDGKRVLRATETSVRIYDTTTNEAVGGTLPHPNRVTAAAFSSDGKRVLTVGHIRNGDELEGHVRVWQTATGELLGQPLIHARSVLEASFSPDGRRVLTACQDGKARLWDVEKSALIGEPMEHKSDLLRALFLSDGKRMLTLDVEGGLRLWDADNAEAIGPIWGHGKPIRHLGFSPNGRLLVTSGEDGAARVWEANAGREIAAAIVSGIPVLYAAFSPDSARFVTVGDDRRARVWDTSNGKSIGSPIRHRTALSLAAFSEDGKRIVTVAADGLRVWDAASGEPIGPLVKIDAEQAAIRTVSLGRDGHLTASVGATGDQSASMHLFFKSDERSIPELKRIAEVLTAVRMADDGSVSPLDRAELAKEWQEARTKHVKDFSPSAERARSWHTGGEAECEKRKLWKGDLLHLHYLISAQPTSDLYARRARANAALKYWEAARTDYQKALASDAGRWELWAGQGEVEAAMGKWDEAIAGYTKAIERQGDRAALWTARGRIEARRGMWIKAAADFAKAIHLGEEDAVVWCQYARTLLANGDDVNYRRWCARIVQRFGESKDETTIQHVVWTGALAEGAVRNWKSLVVRAERSATEQPQSTDRARLLAVLLYRAGQFEKSLNLARKLTAVSDPAPQARDWLLAALAAQRLGRPEEAKQALAKSEETRSKENRDNESWEDRLAYRTLHREAAMVIKGKSP